VKATELIEHCFLSAIVCIIHDKVIHVDLLFIVLFMCLGVSVCVLVLC